MEEMDFYNYVFDFLIFPVLFSEAFTLRENTTDTDVEVNLPRPGVKQNVVCDSVLATGWIVSAVLFFVVLFFCLGIAVQTKRDAYVKKIMDEGR